MNKHRNEGGELVVLSDGFVHIPLRDFPTQVIVHFEEKSLPPPCDPHHNHEIEDYLVWNVDRSKYGWNLNIRWHVQECREIVWKVHYSKNKMKSRWFNWLVSLLFGD
jgi:hypothetical protein